MRMGFEPSIVLASFRVYNHSLKSFKSGKWPNRSVGNAGGSRPLDTRTASRQSRVALAAAAASAAPRAAK